MKTILCYGDSNTWGYVPISGARLPPDGRWTGVLRAGLGEGYSVIEEGLNGRTTVRDDPIEEHKNGRKYLRPCLASHRPLDLALIALGVNDLKARFAASASEVADGAGVLVDVVRKSGAGPDGEAPQVLLVAPGSWAKPSPSAEAIVLPSEQRAVLVEAHRLRFFDDAQPFVAL